MRMSDNMYYGTSLVVLLAIVGVGAPNAIFRIAAQKRHIWPEGVSMA